MNKEDIHLWDVHRMIFGEAPNEFMIEVFIRTMLIYFALLIIVRLMGKRMSGQLTIAEMSVMVTLGAIVSPAMQIPNVGLLQGTLILILALIFQRGINLLELKNYKLEKLNHGEVALMVKDGVLVLPELDKAKLSRQQLFAELRSEGVFNLGEIERVYMEAYGTFSIYKTKNPKPGLMIFPPDDDEIKSFSQEDQQKEMVCISCGNIGTEDEYLRECHICLSTEWTEATLPVK